MDIISKLCVSIMITCLCAPITYADHLGAMDLSRMKVVFTHGERGVFYTDDEEQELIDYYSFYYDPVTENYYIEYGPTRSNTYEIALYEPTNKVKPIVTVNVQGMESAQIRYRYAVRNEAGAKQAIVSFDVMKFDTSLPMLKVESPSRWKFSPAYQIAKQFGANTFGWHNSWRRTEGPILKPGGWVEGFSIQSEYLPRIFVCAFRGYEVDVRVVDGVGMIISNWFPIEPSGEMMHDLERLITDANDYRIVKTLGPAKRPPTDQDDICDTFILDLISDVHEASALGWIKHDLRERSKQDPAAFDTGAPTLLGEAKTIAEKLNVARIHCQKGRFGAAREILRALLSNLDVIREKHLTNEAYFLLKFNIEYLLEKL